MTAPVLRLQRGTPIDVDAMVKVHMDAFKGFFLTSLGPRFLRELYLDFVDGPETVCLTAYDEDGLCGFVVGPTAPRHFFRNLLARRGFLFCLWAVPALLRHPSVVAKRLFGAVFYRGTEPEQLQGGALLSSLAVTPRCAGKGVGSRLVKEFVQETMVRGARFVYLITDRDGNDAVNRFYVGAGFQLETSFQVRGRWMNRYVKFPEARA